MAHNTRSNASHTRPYSTTPFRLQQSPPQPQFEMPPTESAPVFEISNHNVLPQLYQVIGGSGMYTRAKITAMTPAHTKVESKATASFTPVFTFAPPKPNNPIPNRIQNPLANRRSGRLNKAALDLYSPVTDSPSCPPSFKSSRNRAVATVTYHSSSRVDKLKKIAQGPEVAKKLSPTAIVSKQMERMYRETMKSKPVPAAPVISRPAPVAQSPTKAVSLTFGIEATPISKVTPATVSSATVASRPQTSNPMVSRRHLSLRLNQRPNSQD